MEKKNRKQQEIDAQLELANAMVTLASVLESFQDPVLWQKTIANAILDNPQLGAFLQPQIATIQAPLPGRVETVSVLINLTDEERSHLAAVVYAAIQPQLNRFDQFVKESLQDMPANRLKSLAEQIEAGAVPKLARRRGCVFVELDTGYEAYLGM